MELSELFSHMGKLFEIFHWWTILLIIGVTGIMIPINMLYKKLMNTEKLSRLRKTVSAMTVYILSLGIVALFTAILTDVKMDSAYLFGTTVSLGFCSQVLWFIIKFVKDYGWAAIKTLMNNSNWKKMISSIAKQYNVPTTILEAIFSTIDEFLSKVESNSAEVFLANETAIMNNIKTQLKGFTTGNVEDISKAIMNIIKLNILNIDTTAELTTNKITEDNGNK